MIVILKSLIEHFFEFFERLHFHPTTRPQHRLVLLVITNKQSVVCS